MRRVGTRGWLRRGRGRPPLSPSVLDRQLADHIQPLSVLELRSALDDRIVGHSDAKEALLLALVAREHLYLEGPPGAAKTALAEVCSSSLKLKSFVVQLHREAFAVTNFRLQSPSNRE